MENYDIHFRWMRAGILYSEVEANSKTREVEVVNFTDEREEKVFGHKENPTWDDLVRFVESRCIPPTRHNIRDLLDMVGLPKYDAFALFQITSGHFAKDKCYAEIERWIYDYESTNSQALINQSSEGNQTKWTSRNKWYKFDCKGYESLAEYDTHFVYTSFYGKIAEVFANTKTKKVWFKNFTKEPYRLPFGSKEKATWKDLVEFFEDRCFQRSRIDMPDILESLDLESYNPFHIVYAYDGRAFEDDRWIEFIKWEGDYDYAYRS